jgi:multiple sugar transport system substrate-binding protein
MTKKWTILISLLLIVTVLITGCGGATPEPEEPAGGEEPAAPPEAEAVTLRVWTHQNDAFNDGYQALGDAYMAANSNVTIQFETFDYDTYIQTLQTALPAGTEADILQMFGSWVCSYVEGGNLAEVPSSVASLSAAQDAMFAAQLGGYTCDGKLYGLPQEFNIEYGAVLVNTQIAADNGLANTADGWADWDAFIADVGQLVELTDGVMTRAGYNFTASDAIPATFYSLILQNGGQYLSDGSFTVNTAEGRAALELMQRFVDEGLVDPVLFNDEENWVGDSYFEETSAVGLVGPWVVPEYSGDYPEVAEVTQYAPLPLGDNPALVAASGWGLAVSANSAAQEAAWDFVKFVTLNADNAVEWNLASGTLPALKANATGAAADSLVAEFAHFEPFLNILQYAQYEGAFPDRDLVWYDITYPRIIEFLQGNLSLDETLETLEREVNESF